MAGIQSYSPFTKLGATAALGLLSLSYLVYWTTYLALGQANPSVGGYDSVFGPMYYLEHKTTNFMSGAGVFEITYTDTNVTSQYPVYLYQNIFGSSLFAFIVYTFGCGYAYNSKKAATSRDTEWQFGSTTAMVLATVQAVVWSLNQSNLQVFVSSKDAAIPLYIWASVVPLVAGIFVISTDSMMRQSKTPAELEDMKDKDFIVLVGLLVVLVSTGLLTTALLQPIQLGGTNKTSGTMPVGLSAALTMHLFDLMTNGLVSFLFMLSSTTGFKESINHSLVAVIPHLTLFANITAMMWGTSQLFAKAGNIGA